MAEDKKTDAAQEAKIDDKKSETNDVPPVSDPPEAKSESYGSGKIWKWVLIYVILALVVYGAYYYYAMASK